MTHSPWAGYNRPAQAEMGTFQHSRIYDRSEKSPCITHLQYPIVNIILSSFWAHYLFTFMQIFALNVPWALQVACCKRWFWLEKVRAGTVRAPTSWGDEWIPGTNILLAFKSKGFMFYKVRQLAAWSSFTFSHYSWLGSWWINSICSNSTFFVWLCDQLPGSRELTWESINVLHLKMNWLNPDLGAKNA